MTPFDRRVRAQVYRLLLGGAASVDSIVVADSRGWDPGEVEASFDRLSAEHRLALVPGSHRIWMAHPFSGVETGHRSIVGESSWNANCAWDALAILALLGDGETVAPDGQPRWSVSSGAVDPAGYIHLLVPARSFWQDIGFT